MNITKKQRMIIGGVIVILVIILAVILAFVFANKEDKAKAVATQEECPQACLEKAKKLASQGQEEGTSGRPGNSSSNHANNDIPHPPVEPPKLLASEFLMSSGIMRKLSLVNDNQQLVSTFLKHANWTDCDLSPQNLLAKKPGDVPMCISQSKSVSSPTQAFLNLLDKYWRPFFCPRIDDIWETIKPGKTKEEVLTFTQEFIRKEVDLDQDFIKTPNGKKYFADCFTEACRKRIHAKVQEVYKDKPSEQLSKAKEKVMCVKIGDPALNSTTIFPREVNGTVVCATGQNTACPELGVNVVGTKAGKIDDYYCFQNLKAPSTPTNCKLGKDGLSILPCNLSFASGTPAAICAEIAGFNNILKSEDGITLGNTEISVATCKDCGNHGTHKHCKINNNYFTVKSERQ